MKNLNKKKIKLKNSKIVDKLLTSLQGITSFHLKMGLFFIFIILFFWLKLVEIQGLVLILDQAIF